MMKPLFLMVGIAVAWGVFAGCAKTMSGGTDSNTNFQTLCTGSGDCADGLACQCGICTGSCGSDATCSVLAESAECVALGSVAAARCGVATLCTTPCSGNAECNNGLECLDGACVAPEQAPPPEAGAPDSGALTEDRCPRPTNSLGSPMYTCTEPYPGVPCDADSCGLHVGSAYDEDGCELGVCTSDGDCAEGEVCIAPVGCNRIGTFFCQDGPSGSCECTYGADCQARSTCLPTGVVPEPFLELGSRDGRPFVSCEDARGDLDKAIAIFDGFIDGYTQPELRWIGERSQAAADALFYDEACGTDPCELLCELHPCPGTPDCVDRCRAFERDPVYGMLANASHTPGMCTCDVCEDVPFAVCSEIWQCQSG